MRQQAETSSASYQPYHNSTILGNGDKRHAQLRELCKLVVMNTQKLQGEHMAEDQFRMPSASEAPKHEVPQALISALRPRLFEAERTGIRKAIL